VECRIELAVATLGIHRCKIDYLIGRKAGDV
jgi:hypothetical protein